MPFKIILGGAREETLLETAAVAGETLVRAVR